MNPRRWLWRKSSPSRIWRAPRPSRCWPPSATRRCCAWTRSPREFPGIEIFAKAEYFNPGGSVKDRAALNMVLDGERSGKLNHDRIILDSTSGNTGIAYAMIGANRGYKVKLVPAGQRLHGAQAHPEGLRRGDGVQRCRRRLRRRHPPVPRDLHGRSRPLFLSRPVQQSGQLEGALRAHRPGDHQADRRTAHAFRRGHGHQRHLHGRHPPAAARPAGSEVLSRRSLPAASTAWKG